MGEFKFNLLDEPWIRCINQDGRQETLGIKGLFMKAHDLLEVTDHNPLTELSIIRMLLAVIHRAVDGPKNVAEWIDIYTPEKFDGRITDYLEKFRDRFDLFATEYPFYQTPGLSFFEKAKVDGKEKLLPVEGIPVSRIILGTASGNNKTMFDHTTDEMGSKVSPAEAARALITAQMFSLGGLYKKTTNYFGYLDSCKQSHLVKGVHIILNGDNLFETLMFNLLVYNGNNPIPRLLDKSNLESLDRPVWEDNTPTVGTGAGTPTGYLDYLTCKCRHILLVPEREDGTVFVRSVHMAQGKIFDQVINPMCVYTLDKKKAPGGGFSYHRKIVDLQEERMVWRDSQSLFAFEEEDTRPLALRNMEVLIKKTGWKGLRPIPMERKFICAAYGIANLRANPLAWRKEVMDIPAKLLEAGVVPYLVKSMEMVEKGMKAIEEEVDKFVKTYMPQGGKDLKTPLRKEAAQYYWDRMEGCFHELLTNLSEHDGNSALELWVKDIKDTARSALSIALENRYHNSHKAWVTASDELNLKLSKFS